MRGRRVEARDHHTSQRRAALHGERQSKGKADTHEHTAGQSAVDNGCIGVIVGGCLAAAGTTGGEKKDTARVHCMCVCACEAGIFVVIFVMKRTNECIAASYACPNEEATRLRREWREDLVMTSLQSQPPQQTQSHFRVSPHPFHVSFRVFIDACATIGRRTYLRTTT